jgi:DNA-binding CsgD family transcriptional regulator
MSKLAELSYDIQELYIEGHSAKMIASILECNIELVFAALTDMGVADSEELSPFETVNS